MVNTVKIKKIDKNFAAQEDINGQIIKVPSKDVNLYGVTYDKERGFMRFPYEDAVKVSPNVWVLLFCLLIVLMKLMVLMAL